MRTQEPGFNPIDDIENRYKATFPVEYRDLFVGESKVRLQGYRAIVDVERNHTFSVVTSSYQLITNTEAIEMGIRVFEQILGHTIAEKLVVYNVVLPGTRSYCHIDLTVEGHEFSFEKKDKYVPFLRVTNSYNRTRPLSFFFGFCRTICKNGVIFSPVGAKISAYHTGTQIRDLKVGEKDLRLLRNAQAKFTESLLNLSRYAVPPNQMLPLLCKVFQIRVDESSLKKPLARTQAIALHAKIEELTNRYFFELGHNGYAALNVLTDFASNPTTLRFGGEGRIHRYQTDSMKWIEDFTTKIQEKTFSFSDYVGSAAATAKLISNIQEKAEN